MKRSMLVLPGIITVLVLLLTWVFLTTPAYGTPALTSQEPAVVDNADSQIDPGWQWRTDEIDPAKIFGELTDRSLALDSLGRPHVAYGHNHLYYAAYDHGLWRWHVADLGAEVGQFAALALDDADLPHISYYDETNGDLRYAHYNGSVWLTMTVDSAGVVGQYTSIELDASGHPHISYYDVSNSGLKYAAFDGQTWSIAAIDDLGVIGRYTSLALDSMGQPHIAYYGAAHLKYARPEGAGWLVQTVDPADLVGRYASLALDNADHPSISYYDEGNHDVKFAAWDGSSWQVETVDTGQIGDANGGPTSLALKADGQPYIAYFAPDELKLAQFDGADWQIETLPDSGAGVSALSLALDTSGLPRLAVARLQLLRVLVLDGPVWQNHIVDCAGNAGYDSSIVIDENDHLHISYVAGGHLKYAGFDGLEWHMAVVDSNGYNSSLALDSAGHPHISYQSGDTLKYASYDGTGWQVDALEVIGPTDDMPTSLGLDPTDQPHISYCLGTYGYCETLKYAHFNGSTWISTTISSRGFGNSLAVDEAGLPHITYKGENYVEYAFFDGGVWTTSPVGETDWGSMSMALSASGLPRLIYKSDQRATSYGIYDGAAWHIEPALTANEVIYLHSLALDTHGRPHFSYTGWTHVNLDYRLWYAHQTDTGWQEEIVRVGNADNDLALDSYDRPHISTNNGSLLHIYQAQVPLSSVNIQGLEIVGIGQDSRYTAVTAPVDAFEPITITWSSGATGPSASYSWSQPGTYPISVTARNPVSLVTGVMTVTVYNRSYLPVIQGRQKTGDLSGQVWDSDTGLGIQGALVCVLSTGQCATASGYYGEYTITDIPIGEQLVRASADGYHTQEHIATIEYGYPSMDGLFYLVPLQQYGSVAGQVISAVTAQAIGGASVCVASGSPCTTTDGAGNYMLPGVPTGAQTLRASAGGYTAEDQNVEVTANQTSSLGFVLSPTLGQGEMRIVLTWGANPRDLDSHLWLPPNHRYHIYFNNKGNCAADPFACLDVDDTQSYGPETITIQQRFSGTYRYAVNKFAGDGLITDSGAQVKVYDESGLIAEYTIPTSGTGDWWYLFDLDGNTGAITVHNTIVVNSPGSY
jgi:hypothetical protein